MADWNRPGLLEGKVFAVAGAGPATGGAAARIAAREGASVIMLDQFPDEANMVAESIRAGGGRALALQCDLGDRAQIAVSVETALREFGRIDAVFYNAAFVKLDERDMNKMDIDQAEWDGSMGVNLRGPLELARLTIPSMLENGGGAFVFNSSGASLAAEVGVRMFYGISKAGMNAAVRFIAANYGRRGIRANGIFPSVRTGGGGMADSIPTLNCIGRSGAPEEIAEVVIFLCSDRARMVTGEMIHVDGGQSAKAGWPAVRPKPGVVLAN